MTLVEVTEDTLAKVRAFSKVIDAILEERMDSDADYVEMILQIGMERMVQDPLPNDEALKETVADMFRRDPRFVSEYVADRLRNGAEIEATKVKQSWKSYIA